MNDARVLRGSDWVRVHQSTVKYFGTGAALVLHFLMDYQEQTTGELSESWFYCTSRTMEQELSMSKRVQTRLLNKLRSGNLPVIEVTKKGLPARRAVRLLFENIGKVFAGGC